MTINGDRTLAAAVHSSVRAWTVTAAVVGAVADPERDAVNR
jgi:hypothetical protein